MTLKELEIGDKFYNVKAPKEKWIVRGNSVFNARHGSPTRVCFNCQTKSLISKSCKIEVVKTGESIYKEKLKLAPVNFR